MLAGIEFDLSDARSLRGLAIGRFAHLAPRQLLGERFDWGRPPPSLLQRWRTKIRTRAKIGRIRFRLPRFSKQRMPEIAPTPTPPVPDTTPTRLRLFTEGKTGLRIGLNAGTTHWENRLVAYAALGFTATKHRNWTRRKFLRFNAFT
jgi:hypothetical protein